MRQRARPCQELLATLKATSAFAWVKLCVLHWVTQASTWRMLRTVLEQSRVAAARSLASRGLAAWQVAAKRSRTRARHFRLLEGTADREAESLAKLVLRTWRMATQDEIMPPFLSPVSTKIADISVAVTTPASAVLQATPRLDMQERNSADGDSTPPPPPPPRRMTAGLGQDAQGLMPDEPERSGAEGPPLSSRLSSGVQWRAAIWPVPSPVQPETMSAATGAKNGGKMVFRCGPAKVPRH